MQLSKEESDRILRENGLTFFGTITASVTHELNNVMSIVEQMAGLVGDLCVGAEYGRPIENEKLREISGKIARQIDRGVDIIKRLNFFAHSVDEPVKTFEINTLVVNLVELCQRFAALKRVRLEGHYPEEILSLRSNPFILEQALFICIQLAMAEAVKDGLVTVAIGDQEPGAVIAVTGAFIPENEDTATKRTLLNALVNQIRGTVQIESENEQSVIKLQIPHFSEEDAS